MPLARSQPHVVQHPQNKGEGARYAYLPTFESLKQAHDEFHHMAGEVVAYCNAGERPKAMELLKHDGRCTQVSTKLLNALMECGKELAGSLTKGIRNPLRVSDVLKSKASQDILSIDGGATVFDAARLMVDNHVGSVAVFAGGDFLGIFTERGYLEGIVQKSIYALSTPVAEVVDAEKIYLKPDDSIEQCMILMTCAKKRHLPVQDEGKLIGIVSIGDIVKKISSYKDEAMSQLERYIKGNYMTAT